MKELKRFEELVVKYHELLRMPIKAEVFEDLYEQAFYGATVDDGFDVSHSVGADVRNRQNKSGSIKNGKLTWNGHRTTSHKTLEDKINFISQKHADYYVFLARDEKDWKAGKKIYTFIEIDSDLLSYGELEWENAYGTKGNHNGYKAENDVMSAKIVFSMSDQLWTTMSMEYIKENANIYKRIEL